MHDTRNVVVGGKTYIVPKGWSENAALIFIKKYCRSYKDKFAETTVSQVFRRLVQFWTYNERMQKNLFEDLWSQKASPNSPQYFNAGIYKAYGVRGQSIGLWRLEQIKGDQTDGEAVISDYTYVHPQLHACFIQPVNDSLTDIMSLMTKEARLFSRGSGTGTNFSTLRGKEEPISGGGGSSGLISFLKAYDAVAGAIKSGGTTRRAAKMVVLDIDHPDIEEFIDWKRKEEHKAKILIEHGGYSAAWEGEAYQTVSGQNSNNSVSIPDVFMNAIDTGQPWQLKQRTNPNKGRFVSAKKLWWQLCEAAWHCADPGVQFTDTINYWNTTPHCGRIRASNPCSEHLRLDDSACNLASINLCKFLTEGANGLQFDSVGFSSCVQRWVTVLDHSVDLAGYPSRYIADNSAKYRDIGLGYCNLGALLMQACIPYGSDNGRMIASLITSLMTAAAHVKSAELAQQYGQYQAYDCNRHLEIVTRHRDESNRLREYDYPDTTLFRGLIEACERKWTKALELAEEHGLRNAQLTVIAPTGTIGITMDCETTGIEPLFDKVAYKTLAGGGQLTQSAESVKIAMTKLGLTDITDTLAEPVRDIFATAVDTEHGNVLSPADHVEMVAAVQPFVSGGISKTVNLPNKSTIDDIDRIYRLAYDSAVKCIAVYRDGSKTQPLNPMECKTCGEGEACEI